MSKLTKFLLPFIATATLLSQPTQAASHHAQATPKPTDPVVTEVMTKALPDIPGKEVTLKPGQTFYEGPDDIHTVGRNASQTEPAKFVVVLIKKQGAPALTPVK